MPQIVHSTNGANLADVLERVLDRGVVIAGDIRIRLVEVELLTISIRLLIASVDKAREIGIDWWTQSSFLSSDAPRGIAASQHDVELDLKDVQARLARLESRG